MWQARRGELRRKKRRGAKRGKPKRDKRELRRVEGTLFPMSMDGEDVKEGRKENA